MPAFGSVPLLFHLSPMTNSYSDKQTTLFPALCHYPVLYSYSLVFPMMLYFKEEKRAAKRNQLDNAPENKPILNNATQVSEIGTYWVFFISEF